jgi:hypothetical protein
MQYQHIHIVYVEGFPPFLTRYMTDAMQRVNWALNFGLDIHYDVRCIPKPDALMRGEMWSRRLGHKHYPRK